MLALPAPDWRQMFVPSVSPLELVIRGSIMYLAILAAMRIFRRQAGSLNTADLLVVVLVADAAQNGMSSDYKSVTDGLVLVGTIYAWNYLLDAAAFPSIPVASNRHNDGDRQENNDQWRSILLPRWVETWRALNHLGSRRGCR